MVTCYSSSSLEGWYGSCSLIRDGSLSSLHRDGFHTLLVEELKQILESVELYHFSNEGIGVLENLNLMP
jgi:hypothetical protein